jgi:signal peptide peptidase SppA
MLLQRSEIAAARAALRAQMWAMAPRALEQLLTLLEADPSTLVASSSIADTSTEDYEVRDGVAHISISGVMMKKVSPVLRLFGVSATSTQDLSALVNRAASDDDVSAIQLEIDSPGGTVAGTAGLADAVARANAVKPVVAHVPDMAASAAYWVASQASRIVAGPTARVGSIGVMNVVHDTSEAAKMDGLKVHVVKSGYLKGAGVPGAPVTAEQIAADQRMVDSTAETFFESVARGRGFDADRLASVIGGQDWSSRDALRLGLVDQIGDTAAAGAAIEGVRREGIETAAAMTRAHALREIEVVEARIRGEATALQEIAEAESRILAEAELAAMQSKLTRQQAPSAPEVSDMLEAKKRNPMQKEKDDTKKRRKGAKKAWKKQGRNIKGELKQQERAIVGNARREVLLDPSVTIRGTGKSMTATLSDGSEVNVRDFLGKKFVKTEAAKSGGRR